jgi:hypothetical protein
LAERIYQRLRLDEIRRRADEQFRAGKYKTYKEVIDLELWLAVGWNMSLLTKLDVWEEVKSHYHHSGTGDWRTLGF